MKLFVIALILTIHGVIGNPQAGASGGGGASGSAGGSGGGSTDGSAGGSADASAGGSADGSTSGGGSASGSAQLDGCSAGGGASGQAGGDASSGAGGDAAGGAAGGAAGSAGCDPSMAGSADASAAGAATPAGEQGYPTVLKFLKKSQTQPFENSEYMKVDITELDSTVLYKKMVDMSTSPTCEGTISLNGTDIYKIDRKKPATVCGGNKQGSWEDVIAHMFLAAFAPAQSCPVAPGTYPALQHMPPSTVNFIEIPLCGNYQFFGNCDDKDGAWITQLVVLWDILESLGQICAYSK